MRPNPLAQQRRLGAALYDLRIKRGLTHIGLAAKSGVSASVISRLENPFSDITRRPNLLSIRRLLDALEVPRGGDEFVQIEGYAEVAAGGGWWDAPAYLRMGSGQRDYAIVEVGTEKIDEYAGLLLPGLVQTPAYARHRALVDDAADPDAIVAGRVERQRQAQDAAYQLLLEEPAVRRHPAPAAVMVEQLRHLITLAERPNVSIRVVPVAADLGDGATPRAPFAHMTYPDSSDPRIVIVDNVAQSLLVTDAKEVAGYAQLHERLRGAALSGADSAALIRAVADSLATGI